MHDLHFDHPPPVSPRSALRSLQNPNENHRPDVPKRSSMREPPLPVAVGLPPPRKSSLAVGYPEDQDLGPGSHLHLPLPPQPIFEDEQFDVTATAPPTMGHPSLPSLRSPPQVGMRGAKSRASLPRSQGLGHQGKAVSNAPSIHSSSDSSSIASFPLMTPPDAQSYQHHTQFPLPSFPSQQHRGMGGDVRHPSQPGHIHQRTSSMQNNHEQHQLHEHLQQLHHERQQEHRRQQMQMASRHGEDDSPFAYTVDQAEHQPSSSSASIHSFYSHPEYHSTGIEQRQRYGGNFPQQWSRHGLPRHALPERNSSRQVVASQSCRPSISVEERRDMDGPSPYLHPRHGPTRASLPNPAFAGRNSCDSSAPSTASMAANGRILAPLRASPAAMSHRSSLPSMAMVEPPRAAGVSMWRTTDQAYDLEQSQDSSMFPVSPQPLSPTHSTKRPRQPNESPAERQTSWQPQHAQPRAALERRSRSSDRASVRSLDSAMRGAGKEKAMNNNNRWVGPKMSHDEVMARLKEKLLKRIAAKEAAANASQSEDAGNASSQYRTPQDSTRGRGDSMSSSVPSTPATSVISVGSPAMDHHSPPYEEEARHQVAAAASADIEIDPVSPATREATAVASEGDVPAVQTRSAPVMGIESLLSAAAINDQ